MAPYEPKIDSREFEIANSDHVSGSRNGSILTGEPADIVLRLWDAGGPSSSNHATWNADSVFVYMIADLVAASGGKLAMDLPGLMAAHFESSSQALLAARRIATSILEFLACRSGTGFGAAILIQRSSLRISADAVWQSLILAKPGQILLDADISARLHDLPGVQLREVPPLASVDSNGQPGLKELIWTTPERAARLQAAVPLEVPSSSRPPSGATMIVNTPLRTGERPQARPAPPPAGDRSDFVFKEPPASVFQPSQVRSDSERGTPAASAANRSPESLLEGLDDLGPQPFFTRTRIIIGVVAVVLVGAMFAVIYHPEGASKATTPSLQAEPSAVTQEPQAQPPQPVSTQTPPSAKSAETAPKVSPPVTKAPPVRAKPSPVVAKEGGTKETVKPDEPIATGDYAGMSQKDIPRLLQMAQRHAGAGEYAAARMEYRVILQLQPNNQDAKEGLRRLSLIQGDSNE